MRSHCIAHATPGSAGSSSHLRFPGTAGGGVRMNAGAYGREWKDVMIDAVVVDADYVRTLTPIELGLLYRHAALRAGEVVAQVRFQLEPSSSEAVKARASELLAQRKASQPTNKRTFGSVFKNPEGERGAGRMIEECGLKGHRIGGALISPRHANFIENSGGATSADCIALMAEARRRVHDRLHRAPARGALPRAARASGRVGAGGPRRTGLRGCPDEVERARSGTAGPSCRAGDQPNRAVGPFGAGRFRSARAGCRRLLHRTRDIGLRAPDFRGAGWHAGAACAGEGRPCARGR